MKLTEIPLFHGISPRELQNIQDLGCMRQHIFEKNTTIFHMGDTISEIGIVLRGSVIIENIDLWGKRSILSHIPEGHVFAETYAMCGEPLMVSAVSVQDSEILFLNLKRLLSLPETSSSFSASYQNSFSEHTGDFSDPCQNSFSNHSKGPSFPNAGQTAIIRNLLQISMQKNLILSNRIFCTTPKTIRERLMVYLTSQAVKAHCTCFEIPFNRQGLADYLNLDRSALSKELGKMRDEGILEFYKNRFTLHKTAD